MVNTMADTTNNGVSWGYKDTMVEMKLGNQHDAERQARALVESNRWLSIVVSNDD